MSSPAIRITGNQLPVYFQGHHRSVFLTAFGRKPQPVEPASRPA